jgi:hypothetical protein
MNIIQTCPCGARLEVADSYQSSCHIESERFQKAHEACRTAASKDYEADTGLDNRPTLCNQIASAIHEASEGDKHPAYGHDLHWAATELLREYQQTIVAMQLRGQEIEALRQPQPAATEGWRLPQIGDWVECISTDRNYTWRIGAIGQVAGFGVGAGQVGWTVEIGDDEMGNFYHPIGFIKPTKAPTK